MTALFTLAIILSAPFQFLLAHNDPNCGIGGPQANSAQKGHALGVINGVDAVPHEFPYLGSLRRWDDPLFHFCASSILNKRWLVTAAHCVKRIETQPEMLRVILNAWNVTIVEDDSIDVNVSKIIVYPNYTESRLNWDVALLKLDRDIDLTNPDAHIGSICLPEQDEPIDKFAGKSSTTCGWGWVVYDDEWLDIHVGNHNQTDSILKKVNLTIWRQEFCKEAYVNSNVMNSDVTEQMICASDYEKGSCKGDSGGPLVTYEDGKWTLQGIVSWSDPCAIPYHPSVNTRVSKFVDWIWDTVKHN